MELRISGGNKGAIAQQRSARIEHSQMRRYLSIAFLVIALPASAQTTIDGDTIEIGGVIYRLWGIDAAESAQSCSDGWRAGIEASNYLRALMKGRNTTCEAKTQDRYGRTVALCRADGSDLSAAMVSAGMAYAFVRYSRDYVRQEEEARGKRLGVHGHGCEKPWDWRAMQRRARDGTK